MKVLSALWSKMFKEGAVLVPQDKVLRIILEVTGMT